LKPGGHCHRRLCAAASGHVPGVCHMCCWPRTRTHADAAPGDHADAKRGHCARCLRHVGRSAAHLELIPGALGDGKCSATTVCVHASSHVHGRGPPPPHTHTHPTHPPSMPDRLTCATHVP
jgi:hypothetical protein